MDKYADSKFIFVVGIGGSDLASKAVWHAMTLHKLTNKKLFFLESPDSREYEEVENFVKNEITGPEEMVLIIVSKSGRTAETLEAFHKTFEILSEKFGTPINNRVLVISSPETPLWQLAEQNGFEKIEWQGNVGGRFSAFTVAHTIVLSISGLDANTFVAGSKEIKEEEAKHLAQNIFDNYGSTGLPQINILDFFIFNSELEDLGKWCRQLIAESLSTFTPTVSIGPVDLHSMLELYLEKPDGRFTVFVRSEKEIHGSVNEKSYENIISKYEKTGLPFYKYEMPEINEFELGKFMAFMITVTLELAKLLGVDPYDQPAVEEYKKSLHNS